MISTLQRNNVSLSPLSKIYSGSYNLRTFITLKKNILAVRFTKRTAAEGAEVILSIYHPPIQVGLLPPAPALVATPFLPTKIPSSYQRATFKSVENPVTKAQGMNPKTYSLDIDRKSLPNSEIPTMPMTKDNFSDSSHRLNKQVFDQNTAIYKVLGFTPVFRVGLPIPKPKILEKEEFLEQSKIEYQPTPGGIQAAVRKTFVRKYNPGPGGGSNTNSTSNNPRPGFYEDSKQEPSQSFKVLSSDGNIETIPVPAVREKLINNVLCGRVFTLTHAPTVRLDDGTIVKAIFWDYDKHGSKIFICPVGQWFPLVEINKNLKQNFVNNTDQNNLFKRLEQLDLKKLQAEALESTIAEYEFMYPDNKLL